MGKSTITNACPSEHAKEQLLAGLLDEPAMEAIEEHLAECARCRARMALMVEEGSRFRALLQSEPAPTNVSSTPRESLRLPSMGLSGPSGPVEGGLEESSVEGPPPRGRHQNRALSRKSHSSHSRPGRLVALTAVVGLTLALVGLLSWRMLEWSASMGGDLLETEHTKGGGTLTVFVKQGEEVTSLVAGRVLHPGDGLRFVPELEGYPYLLVCSREESGRFNVYYPYDGVASGAVGDLGEALPGSLVLDTTTGGETLVGVFSLHPVAASLVEAFVASPRFSTWQQGSRLVCVDEHLVGGAAGNAVSQGQALSSTGGSEPGGGVAPVEPSTTAAKTIGAQAAEPSKGIEGFLVADGAECPRVGGALLVPLVVVKIPFVKEVP